MKFTNKFKTLFTVISLVAYVNANVANAKMTILPFPQPGDDYQCLIPEGCPTMEHRIHELECIQENVVYNVDEPVNAVQVTIVYVMTGNRPVVKSRFEAVVTKGLLFIGKFIVNKSVPEAIGSPTYYLGRDFELEVRPTVTPVDGGMPAHLVVDNLRGDRISEDMLCRYVR
ncbi:MAG: hypothetical protein AABZ06_09610 [Bdellovibrionota bacterium]